MISLKIRTLVIGILLILGTGTIGWFSYDYYTLRRQHREMLLYLVQPVKTDAQGNPIQRAQALDELIPRTGANGTANPSATP